MPACRLMVMRVGVRTGLCALTVALFSCSLNREAAMFPSDVEAFDQLPASERLRLLLDLWERVAAHPGDVPVTAAQLAELEDRMDDDDANPEAGIPLEEARTRLRNA